MDVPTRKEFLQQQSMLEALCRYLSVVAETCDIHREFRDSVLKAVKNCDTVPSYDCAECGASYQDELAIFLRKK